MKTYFNENDPGAAAWLRSLIEAGHLQGEVDERSIAEVEPESLAGYGHCHFFAGIGGWAYALRLAGWPDERSVCTGSCPCQPFSTAGKRKGQADKRHLWPVFFRLIRERRPATIFGEQVDGDDGYRWLARVRDDLEEAGYAVGCADLPACSAGAPTKRNRLFFVASLQGVGRGEGDTERGGRGQGSGANERAGLADGCGVDALARAGGDRTRRIQRPRKGAKASDGLSNGREAEHQPTGSGGSGAVALSNGALVRGKSSARQQPINEQDDGIVDAVGCTDSDRSQGHERRTGQREEPRLARPGPWSDFAVVHCRDGKTRRVPTEPALFPLAARLPGSVGLLRGAGNSIVPQVAAAFIQAFLEAEQP